jgi:hypothetical protein
MARRDRRRVPDVLAARARIPQHVVHRSFAHETVVLNLKTGRYHGLNPTAGRMLAELETGAPVGEIAARLAEVYERPLAEIEGDLEELCLDLAKRGLVELMGGDGTVLETAGSDDAA